MSSVRRIGKAVVGVCAGLGGLLYGVDAYLEYKSKSNILSRVQAAQNTIRTLEPLPNRNQMISDLESTEEFDVLIIGGGATGAGVCLDAVTRGLSTALVEKSDYSSGTSSRSTKLIHGGVRYLQKAILGLDYEQFKLVKEALYERANLLQIAPHLSEPLPIMLPVYKWWQLPYYYAGIKCYDIVAGKQLIRKSYVLSKRKSLDKFPMLKKDQLVGSLVYYDGQHNDARMNIAIVLTALRRGAKASNHCEVVKLLKKTDPSSGKEVVSGATVRDRITGKVFDVKAKCVINATGPFTDTIRLMEDDSTKKICQPSSGVHIVLPGYYSPTDMGLLDPSTSDGRVIFFLPWLGRTVAGTTDTPCNVTFNPSPTEKEIQFILKEVRNYLNDDVNVRRGDVQSAWSGIRPLVSDPNKADTQSLARNHVIEVSNGNLITIAGGKWTTYRSMAADTVDCAIKACELTPEHPTSQTNGLLLEGAENYTPTLYIRLVQDYGLDAAVAAHLVHTYGDQAFTVADMAKSTGRRWPVAGLLLADGFPYIEAEVRYAVQEHACTAVDVLARRTRLSFLNVQSAEEALPRVIEIMAEEMNWDKAKQKKELETATTFLYDEMGAKAKKEYLSQLSVNLSSADILKYSEKWRAMDEGHKGYVTTQNLRHYFEQIGESVTEDQLQQILKDVDMNSNAKVELDEFLMLVSAVKSGEVQGNRLADVVMNDDKSIPVHRSGGGV